MKFRAKKIDFYQFLKKNPPQYIYISSSFTKIPLPESYIHEYN